MITKTRDNKEVLKISFRNLLSKDKRKTLVTAQSYRESRQILGKILDILEQIGLYYECHKATDHAVLKFKENELYFTPITLVDRVRGYRADDIVILNSEMIDRDIVEKIELSHSNFSLIPLYQVVEKIIDNLDEH